ncbi:MAG: A/G-specific adenine glycosylase [Chlamydiae bacterium]|nr:A/G-specific adenine glycosylase [Chlamydiota bacterium]MBI3276577.1 A/G-specific adenine glycosylase [Chlamydiota bacterium]
MEKKSFTHTLQIQKKLLAWYHQYKRDLPWRQTKDPYAIWVSEMMLQQTQVKTVIPYYERWIRKFPNVKKLAQAPLDQVLKHWEGLGYYSRARNLHKGAQWIVEKYGGRIPQTSKELIELPGIGLYTANAIASIAFDKDVPVVDGNVKRVLSRIFLLSNDPGKIYKEAERLLVKGEANSFNQAMMELGATVCMPQNPVCLLCPIQSDCKAFQQGLQGKYPIAEKRIVQKNIKTFGGLIWKKGKLLIRQRPLKGLLGGLWEFPTYVTKNGEGTTAYFEHLKKEVQLQIKIGKKIGDFKHIYTHLIEWLEIYDYEWVEGQIPRTLKKTWVWVSPEKLKDFPFSGICAKVREKVQNKD